jgi:thiosulfate dehydrogenase
MSYQPGSSMHRVLKAAQFIKYNMPRGVTWANPILTDEEAIDVAAYINDDKQHIRPTSESGAVEYPVITDKPVSYHKGPFADPYKESQHKFGPWTPIIDWRKENKQTTGY